ncbi:hypothetical protein SAMN05421823_103438 [Catalinimonas alkaloidigena]|uniref:Uncharacterized protein n=1 Tax=Catalinimonas alkaloidigena TaxID=1075417 RepID=A0A1G9EDY5_9BACT|nr:hypothetical protein [Catalinimonas alkaloidigena]SDK74324.1 hypothetical protein SAMN05421823_103438 [Catalinimonas alkaloidigena]
MKKKLFFLLGVLWSYAGIAQSLVNSEHGYLLPARDTTRLLVIFAEVDCGACGQSSACLPDNDAWRPGQLPPDAARYFDATLRPGEAPHQYITNYYHTMSRGEYVLLGDYIDRVVTVPCHRTSEVDVIRELNTWPEIRLHSQRSSSDAALTLEDFDLWGSEPPGVPKSRGPDGILDGVVIFWRNLNKGVIDCGGGLGMQVLLAGQQLHGKKLRVASSFGACRSGQAAWDLFIAEQLHALFGGNNFHTVGGAGLHTFMIPAHVYGTSAQSGASSLLINGWERHRLGWRGRDAQGQLTRQYLIGALEATGTREVPTDLKLPKELRTDTFLLRDFVTTGDAVHIQLPHLDWQQVGDVKNQYLWLENHQLISPHDVNIWHNLDCRQTWSPGLYAQIQVGKDLKEGASADVFPIGSSRDAAKPNALGSYMFPVTAEGNWDYTYRYDKALRSWEACVWAGNWTLPTDAAQKLPNPFTGHSDLYSATDSNHDRLLDKGDKMFTGSSKVYGDSVVHALYSMGDAHDAFRLAGNSRLALGTNPAPVPVYTHRSGSKLALNRGPLASYENRQIHLNGLEVRILEENVDGKGAMKISIRWDQYRVEQDQRWAGDIVLYPHDFEATQPSLELASGRTITLARGQSPTYMVARTVLDDSVAWFSDTTRFTLMSGAFLTQETGSTIVLTDGTQVVLEAGAHWTVPDAATLTLRGGSTLVLQSGATLEIGPGALQVEDGSRLLVEAGATLSAAKRDLRRWQKRGLLYEIPAATTATE